MLKSPYFAEFKRNLWLEFTKGRLIILSIIALLSFLIANVQFSETHVRDAQETVKFFLNAAIFLGLFWGVSRVVDSVRDEIHNHTWDFQRLSALPPLPLMLGKVFGSVSFALFTAFVFYAIGILFIVLYPDGSFTPAPDQPKYSWRTPFEGFDNEFALEYYKLGLIGFSSLIFSYLAGFAATMRMAQGLKNKKKFGDALLKGGAIIAGALFAYTSMAAIHATETFDWYNIQFSGYGLMFFLLSFCLLWALYAGYQSIRGELQFTVTPFAMILFALTSTYLICGFIPDAKFMRLSDHEPHLINTSVQTAFYMSICFGYLIMLAALICFTENISLLRYRKMWTNIKSGNTIAAWENSPRWIYIFALALISFFIYFIYSITVDRVPLLISVAYISVIFFTVRDLCVWHILNFKNPKKTHHITFIIYLLIFYGALPYLFSVSTNDTQLLYIFFPDIVSTSDTSNIDYGILFPPIAQAALTFGYLLHFLQTKARQQQEIQKP